jgi:nitroreductase
MDAYDAIIARTSTRAFADRPVPRAVLERLLAAAVRAPNHKLTEPWRFAMLGPRSAARFAEIKRAHRATKFADPASPEAAKAIDKTYREALGTPVFVVVMCAVSEDAVRREEDYAATMMAAQNLMIAATAEGLGSYVRTGGMLEDADMKTLVRLPAGHRIVAVVSLGYPAAPQEARKRGDPAGKTLWLE